jgi:hypothetical protein
MLGATRKELPNIMLSFLEPPSTQTALYLVDFAKRDQSVNFQA